MVRRDNMYKLKRLLIYVISMIVCLQLVGMFTISGSSLNDDNPYVSTADEIDRGSTSSEVEAYADEEVTLPIEGSTDIASQGTTSESVEGYTEEITNEPSSTSELQEIEKTEVTNEEVTEEVEETKIADYQCDFNNVIYSKDIPEYSAWETIGYLTCESIGLYRIPITYGWSQDKCDSRDIVMDSYNWDKFGVGKGVFLCGHNYKVLSNLKNVKVNDTILIETTYGANLLYQVNYSNKSWLEDSGTWFYGISDLSTGEMLQSRYEDGNTLGVFTCHDTDINPKYRWYVRAVLVKGTTII